ncbi:MAG: hypothetical protein CMJ26_06605 [Phycisphaerae bacterium]|nr:hypothetical protein [Phycisphaerae bacterium]
MTFAKRLICLVLFLGVVLGMFGCRKALFPKNKQRNQFEAYNTMRYGPQITEQPDLFGLPEPALRERLGNKE